MITYKHKTSLTDESYIQLFFSISKVCCELVLVYMSVLFLETFVISFLGQVVQQSHRPFKAQICQSDMTTAYTFSGRGGYIINNTKSRYKHASIIYSVQIKA